MEDGAQREQRERRAEEQRQDRDGAEQLPVQDLARAHRAGEQELEGAVLALEGDRLGGEAGSEERDESAERHGQPRKYLPRDARRLERIAELAAGGEEGKEA